MIIFMIISMIILIIILMTTEQVGRLYTALIFSLLATGRKVGARPAVNEPVNGVTLDGWICE